MATVFQNPERWRLGPMPVTGTEIFQGNPRPSLQSLAAFDRGNRDSFLQGINAFKTGAANAGYAQNEIDDYFKTNIAPDWNNTQRSYFTGQGESFLKNALRNRLGNRYGEFEGDINDEVTRYSYMQRPDIDAASDADIVNIPQRLYGDSASSSIIGALNNRVRGNAMSAFQNTFKQKPFQMIDDTADDEAINKVVGEQYGTAREGIDRQYKRGALNDFGKNKAYQGLDVRKGQVASRLQDRGKTVLDTLRQRAQGIYDSAEKAASGASIDSPFDVNNFSSQYQSAIDSGRAGLEGSFRDMVSPDEFNVQDILGGSYSAQGPTNKNAPILAAIEARNKVRSGNRGLGTTGAF